MAVLLVGGLAGGCSAESPSPARTDVPAVYAVAETEPVRGGGDAADDPAIWIHPEDASMSLILGTDKRRGLSVYDLSGREVQFLARGRVNNVDLRQGVAMADGAATLAAATNRTERTMDIFSISAEGKLELALAQALEIGDPYGICMHLDAAGNRTPQGGAILVASSQGDYTFAFYDLNNGDRYLGSVRVADDPAAGIDGAEETDGLAVTSVNLGPGFEQGMLVVQDGFNRLPEERQNFKLVPWSAVAAALNLPAAAENE